MLTNLQTWKCCYGYYAGRIGNTLALARRANQKLKYVISGFLKNINSIYGNCTAIIIILAGRGSAAATVCMCSRLSAGRTPEIL